MTNLRTRLIRLVLALSVVLAATPLFAASYTAIASGNFNDATRYTPTPSLPFTASDDIVINQGVSLTVSADTTVKSISFNTGGNVTLSIASGITLNVAGVNGSGYGVDVADPGSITNTIAVGDGKLTVTNKVRLTGGTGAVSQLTLAGGTIDINNNLDAAGGAANAHVDLTGTGRLKLAGNWASGMTVTTGTSSTVEIDGSGAQSIPGYSFRNFEVNKASGTATFSGQATVFNNLHIYAGTLSDGGNQINNSITGSGALTIDSGAQLEIGTATSTNAPTLPLFTTYALNAASVVLYDADAAQPISPNATYGILKIQSPLSGSRTKSLFGFLNVNGDLYVNNLGSGSVTLDVNSQQLTIAGGIAGSGAIDMTSGGQIKLGGDFSNSGTFTAGTGTVQYDGGSTQNVKATTYNTLIFTGTNTTGLPYGNITATTLQIDANDGIYMGGQTLTIAGNLLINGTIGVSLGINNVVFTNSGTIDGVGLIYPNVTSMASRTILNTANLGFVGNVTLAAGQTVTNNGIVSISNSLDGIDTAATWLNNNNATLNVGGNVFNTFGTLNASAAGNTVAYKGGNQTVRSATYHHLLLYAGASGLKTLPSSVTVNGDFTVDGFAGADVGTTLTVGGDVTINSGAQLNGNSGVITVGGDWIKNGTFSAGTSSVIFNSSLVGQSVSASPFYDITFSGNTTKTLAGALDVDNNFSIAGTFAVSAGTFTHHVGGTWSNAGTFNAGTSEIIFDGASGQSIQATPFYKLTINKPSGSISLSGNVTVANDLTLQSASYLITNANTLDITGKLTMNSGTFFDLTSGTVRVGGDLTTDGSMSASSGMLEINGASGIQNWGGTTAPSIASLKVNKGSGSLNMTTTIFVAGTLDLTDDVIVTSGAVNVTSGSVTRTSGYVDGLLSIAYPSPGTRTFDLGTTLGYSPITITALSAGTIEVTAFNAVEPNNTGGGANLLQTYWDISSSTVTGPVDIVYTWPAAAVNGTEANYVAGFYNGTAWSRPSGTLNTGTHSMQLSGVSSYVGDWTAGASASVGGAVTFAITGSGTTTAGSSNSITITALDSSNATATGYTGPHTLVFSGANLSPNGTAPVVTDTPGADIAFGGNTTFTFVNGAVTTTMKLYMAQTAFIDASEASGPSTATPYTISVAEAPASALSIPTINNGDPVYDNNFFSVDVESTDAYGNPSAVATPTNFTLSTNCACSGTLGGTVTGTLNGTTSVTVSGLTYTPAETNVVLRATQTAGDPLTAGDSAPFNVLSQVASLTVINTNDSGAGSLRDAITTANAGGCTQPCPIGFNITPGGPVTIALTSSLPSLDVPMSIDATTQPGYAGTPLVTLDGTSASGNGFKITGGSSTIKGFLIQNFDTDGIFIETGGSNTVQSCWIGLNATGTGAAANNYGIEILSSDNNTIGGNTAAARNVISGNAASGILLNGSSASNTIAGNYIGTDVSGTAAVANNAGVTLFGSASNNIIGGGTASAGNVISGNVAHGIYSAGTIVVVGSIHTDTSPIRDANVIKNNYIGVAVDGATTLANGIGIELKDDTTNTSLGGNGTGNVISGNGDGIVLNGATLTGSLIQGNKIGVASDGTTPAANTGDGIKITNASSSLIGGVTAGDGNTIANNGGIGIKLAAGSGNQILGNSIFSNTGLGIDLNADGTDTQDNANNDSDAGANGTQSWPEINSASVGGGTLSVDVSLFSSAANGGFARVQFFEADSAASGEGRTFIGDTPCVSVASLSNAVYTFGAGSLAAGDPLVATATTFTDPGCGTAGDGTSEFSPASTVATCTPASATITAPPSVCASGTGYTASVPTTLGATYAWGITNGTITSATNGSTITFDAGATGSVTLTVSVTTSTGCPNSSSDVITINPNPAPIITGPTSVCAGNSVTLDAGSGYATYSWSTGQTSQSITVTPTGTTTYTATVTTASGCSGSDTHTVTFNPTPTVTITGPTSTCGSGSVTLDAGAGFATYSWSTGQTSQAITVTPGTTTTYTVNVTDGNGCNGSDSHTVTVTNPAVTITGPTTACNGGSVTLDAGAGFATYNWSTGQTSQTITVTPTGTTTYTVNVTDSNGCNASDSHTVTATSPTVTITGPTTACGGGSVTLDAGAGFTTYNWSTGQTSQTITVTPTGTTTYTVNVTDSNGCNASDSHTVTVTSNPAPVITGPSSTCPGTPVTLDAGAGFASYSWSTGQTSQTITVTPTALTTYSVTVTAAGGCTGSDSHTVALNANPTVTITGPTSTCPGTPVTLDAGAGFATYNWSTGQTSRTITVTPTSNTTYTVNVTDGNGCSGSDSHAVALNSTPAPVITGPASTCNGTPVTLDAGSGFTTYSWSTGQTSQTITVTPTIDTTYSVVVTNASGCSGSTSHTVTVNTPPVVTITGPASTCQTAAVTLDAGAGFTTYSWSTGQTSQTITVTPTSNTTYTVTVTDGNGCTGSDSHTVSVNTNPTVTITGPASVCNGSSITLDAGAGFATYNWSTGQTSQSITVSPTTNTTYTVNVTDVSGCTASDSHSVAVNSLPAPTITGPTATCAGTPVTLDAGSGFTTYNWSSGQTTQTITVTPSSNTTFVVTVSNASGCTATDSHSVTVNTPPTVTITGPTSTCTGTPVTLDAGAGFTTYSWSTGQTSQSITVTPTSNTTYTVNVTDGNGCSGSASQTVTITSNPSATITAPATTCANATGLTASVAPVGGATYNWTISGGTITAGQGTSSITFDAAASGTLNLGITITAGSCSGSGSKSINVLPLPSATISGPAAVCPNTNFTLDAGAGFTTYTWSTGATTQTITVSQNATTTYSVSVTNASGCSSSASKTVALSSAPIANLSAPLTVDENSTGNHVLVATQAGATYLWSVANGTITNGQGTPDMTFTAGASGNVTISIVVTIGSCSANGSVNVPIGVAPVLNADLAITKSGPASAEGGSTIQYTLAITNIGPNPASGVVVTDSMPAGMTAASANGSGWNCTTSAFSVACSASSLAVGAASPITITAVAPSQSGDVTNSAAVQSATGDPNSSNNTASATTTISGTDNTCPSTPPSLLSPANGAANVTSPVTFAWSPVTGAAFYELWINSGGTTTLATTTASTTHTTAVASGPLSWFVVAKFTTACNSLMSATRSLTVSANANCDSHSAPQLTAPSAGSDNGSPVTFAWTAVPQAVGYRIWISVDGGAAQDIGTTNGAITFSANVPSGSISAYVEALFSGCPATRSESIGFKVAKPGCDGHGTATPITPAANSTVSSSLVDFSWTAVPDADGYRVWVAVNDGIAQVVGVTTTGTTLSGAIPAGSIDWWVETLFDGCPSTESQHRKFTLPASGECGTARPELIAPAAGTTLTSSSVTFSWTAVPNVVGYELWLALGNGTPTLIATTNAFTTSVATNVATGEIEWFVRALVDRCPARESQHSRFTLQPPANCADNTRPVLATPLDRAHAVSPVSFSWSTVPGATSYELVIESPQKQFKTIPTTETFADKIQLPNGRTTWFVRAHFANCPPLVSTNGELQIVSAPAACAPLDAPILAAPAQMSTNVSFPLQWTEIPGATSYQLQLSSDAGFSGGELITTDETHHDVEKSNDGTTPIALYARVRAINGNCQPVAQTSAYSATSAVFILPHNGSEGAVPVAEADVVTYELPLGAELAGQAFIADATEPWLTVSPSSGVVAAGGSTLIVTANTTGLPVGTSLGGIRVTLTSAQRSGIAANGTTTKTTPVSISLITPVTPTPKSTPPPDALIIPAVAHADGINSKFQSDVRVSNTSPQVMKYQLTFTPSGDDGIATGKQTTLSIDPGRTIAIDDVLKSWFSGGVAASSTGVLEIRPLTQTATTTTSEAVKGLQNFVTFASSRTFNVATNGTFGQYIPAVPYANFVGGGGTDKSVLSLQQIAQSDKFRTNLGLVEGSGQNASALVTVFGKGGQQLTQFPVELKGGQHTQLNSFLTARGVTSLDDGRIEVKVTSSTGKITAYASVLDQKTADPLLVSPVVIADSGNTKWVVPGVADLANGLANWQTDLRLFNAGTDPVEATLSFYSQNGGAPKTTKVTLPAGDVKELDRTLASVFGVTNDGGAVHITTEAAARLVASARTYNLTANGTYGQFIPAVTSNDAASLGTRPLQILQVEESDRYRSNIGLAEVTGKPVTLELTIIPPDAKITGRLDVKLGANEFRQIGSLLRSLGMGDTFNARVTVRVKEGEGRVSAYASTIDMQTQDPTYVPAQ